MLALYAFECAKVVCVDTQTSTSAVYEVNLQHLFQLLVCAWCFGKRPVSNSMSCWPMRLSLVPIRTSIPQLSATKLHQFAQNCFMGTPLCMYLLCVIAHLVSLPLRPLGLLLSSIEAADLWWWFIFYWCLWCQNYEVVWTVIPLWSIFQLFSHL